MSHRRLRHLPFSLGSGTNGAKLVLYAPAIKGYANYDLVETWADLSGKGNDATASVIASRPTYRTAIQGGMPGLNFFNGDGVVGNFNYTLNAETVIQVFQAGAPQGTFARYFTQSDASLDYVTSNLYIPLVKNGVGNNNITGYDVTGFRSIIAYNSAWSVATATHSGSSIVNFLNGIAGSSASGTLSKTFTRFGIGTTPLADNIPSTEDINGYIGGLVAYSAAISASLRQRIQQSNGFTFRIATK
jgi:hypothetical protein